MLFSYYVLAIFLNWTSACMTSTLAKGNCVESLLQNFTFCNGKLSDYVCVPIYDVNWNWTIFDKEAEVRDVFVMEMENIMNLEAIGVTSEFSTNEDCTKTLKEIMCRMNFPYCANDTSFNVCGSGCDYLLANCITNIKVCEINKDINQNDTVCAFGMLLTTALYVLII